MIALVVVNFGRPAETIDCIKALQHATTGHASTIFLVENGVAPGDAGQDLREWTSGRAGIEYISLPENLGFAGACNVAIDRILADEAFEAVALVNNDAIVSPGWLDAMIRRMDPARRVDMVASRMMAAGSAGEVDSLGIAMYRCGLAANRKCVDEPLLGPCGGAALYSTRLLRQVQDLDGHVFEPVFFCYAEDTDLALRARLLGFAAAYADDATSQHAGSLTSGGGNSDFVMYHGLRNSLSVMCRSFPASFLLRFAPWILVVQCAVVVKYLARGKATLLWRVYRDFFRLLPGSLAARRRLRARGLLRWKPLRDAVCPRLYVRGYIMAELRALVASTATRGAIS